MATSNAKKVSVSLSPDMLMEAVDELNLLDSKVSDLRGDPAAIRDGAEAALLAENDGFAYVSSLLPTLREQLEDGLAYLEQMTDEAVDAIMADSKDDLAALETIRATLGSKADALAKILSDMLPDVELPIIPAAPEPPKAKGTRGPGRPVTDKEARYFRTIDGVKQYQGGSQNKVSSLAYYYSEHIDGKRMRTVDFVNWAVKNHKVDVKQATAWEVRLSDKVTVGMDPAIVTD